MAKLNQSLVFFSLIVLLVLQVVACPVFCSALSEDKVDAEVAAVEPVFQKGMSYSGWSPDAYSNPESDESLSLLTETNTEWIALCFSWAQSNTTSTDIQPDPERTPTVESLRRAITTAHSLGLKVMLKPMVDTLEEEKIQGYGTVWRGEILPSAAWFESYSDFINYFADFAEQNSVEMFCVGCEFKATTSEKAEWENVIQGVRERYSGPITYAADWTNYKNIEWWDSVDYVGIDAYFLLTLFDIDPTLEELKSAWNNHANDIEEWVSTVNKPVIFTEIGYRSGDGTAMAPSNYWSNMALDLQEQVDCYEAVFETLWNRDWFYGFYWWTWIHDPTKGGLTDTSHTPQNKPVQDVITEWYSTDRQFAVVDQTFTSTTKTTVNKPQQVGFHLSWENDGTDVVSAKIYVNETEYTTNATGWISFSISYETVGKRTWTVTDVQHSQSNGYTVIAENPSVIWDETEIQVEVDSTAIGTTKVKTRIVNAYEGTPVTGATTEVNGETCQESEPGVYEIELFSLSPYQQLTVTTQVMGLEIETLTTSTFHVLNIALYVGLVIAIILALIVFLKWRRRTPDQTN